MLKQNRQRRKIKIKAKIFGNSNIPRLSVFRSANHIYCQIIDDKKQITLVSAHDKELKDTKGTKSDIASMVGQLIAEKALKNKIKTVVFDRSGYKYHGRVKNLAESARKAGLKF